MGGDNNDADHHDDVKSWLWVIFTSVVGSAVQLFSVEDGLVHQRHAGCQPGGGAASRLSGSIR